MRLRATDYLGLLLSQFLALGIALGAPSAAWAQGPQPWTTVGSAGTVDESSTSIVTLDGPNALLTGFRRGGATIRYNIVAVDGLFGQPAIDMLVRYRATPDPIVAGRAGNRVFVQLIEVNLFTGTSTTKLVLDSDDFQPSADFQTNRVSSCPNSVQFDFANNAYYIEADLGKRLPFSGVPALQAIQVSVDICIE